MAKKSFITPAEIRSVTTTSSNATSTKRMLYPPKNPHPSKLWLWIMCILVIGLIIFGSMSYIALHWFNTIHITLGAGTTQPTITTYDVQREGIYAELSFTVLNAQYATTFPNDTIQTGPALVRINLRVSNRTTDQVSVIYYDVARL